MVMGSIPASVFSLHCLTFDSNYSAVIGQSLIPHSIKLIVTQVLCGHMVSVLGVVLFQQFIYQNVQLLLNFIGITFLFLTIYTF